MTDEIFHALTSQLKKQGRPFLTEGRYRASAVVTTQNTGWLWRYEGLKFRMMYGVGLLQDAYGHSAVNQGFDAVFVHGAHSRECLLKWLPPEKVIIGGFPKYAPALRCPLSRAIWQRRFGLDEKRPTVLYLSTWAHHSAIDRFSEAVGQLGERYNVLYKPHHNNLHFELERLARLRTHAGVTVVDDERSVLPFYAVADAVIADLASGGLTEAFLMDLPTVALSPHLDAADDRVLDETYQATLICRQASDLAPLVAEALERDPLRSGRQHLSERLFSPLAGKDDQVVARQMIRLVRKSRPSPWSRLRTRLSL